MIGDRPVEGKVPLSVAIITKNEEEMLPSCLKSVSFADEIVVVDSGSTDRTIEVAKEYGCRVFVEQWKGFGLQKLSAIEKCTHDWILVLDADERIPDETRAEVTRVIEEPKAQAYSFPRKNHFRGKLIRHGTWGADEVVRLFRKGGATISGRLVHEAIEADSTAKIAAPIYHYPDTSASGVRRKMDAYSSAGAEQLFSEGKRSSICKAVSSGLAAFLKCYFLKLGMLDGKAGFIIAVNDGIYAYYKYSRLLELQERAQG
jgi:glycosyltransferase involved in cell wall biosynthesis